MGYNDIIPERRLFNSSTTERQQLSSCYLASMDETPLNTVSSLRKKANHASSLRCDTLICVIENPSNIENIGTVLRNIDALGISKLYVINQAAKMKQKYKDIQSTLKRVSVSADRWVYVHPFATTLECVAHLVKNNYISLGTSPHIKGGVNMPLYDSDYTNYKKLAIWFGNEAKGLSTEALATCAGCIQIHMAGIVESLNLAVSTGIVLSYIAHCRREYKNDKK